MLTLADDTALLWLDPAIGGGAVVDVVVVDCVLTVLNVLAVLAVVLVVLVVLL